MTIHLICTQAHAASYMFSGEDGKFHTVDNQPGKESVDGVLEEGDYLRRLTVFLSDIGKENNITLHLLTSGIVGSTMKHRIRAVNNLVDEIGSPERCIHIEPHINASGMGRYWQPARGQKIFHNGRYRAEEIARKFDKNFSNMKPINTKSRGVTKKWFKGVKCASLLTELLFMTNREECDSAIKQFEFWEAAFRKSLEKAILT